MPTRARPDLERFQYWQGQTLASRDFTSQLAVDAELRAWHARSLHRAAGIAWGFDVSEPLGGGGGGDVSADTHITVKCGVAYDCEGRELVLQSERSLKVPTLGDARQLTLFVRLAADHCGCHDHGAGGAPDPFCRGGSGGSASGGASTGSGHALQDALTFSWESRDVPTNHRGIPLARLIAADAGGLAHDPDFRAPHTRALARPRLATGETVHGNTPWEPWREAIIDVTGGVRELIVGVQTRVDTSAAGFTAAPCYFATLEGGTSSLLDDEFAPAFFTSIADPSADGFTFRLLMQGLARRRLIVAAGWSRVTDLSLSAGAPTKLTVNTAGAFRAGDTVARVSPRSRLGVGLTDVDDAEITLAEPIAGLKAGMTLAVAYPPATARVTQVSEQELATAVDVDDVANAEAGDLIVRIADEAAQLKTAAIEAINGNTFTLTSSIQGLADGDELGSARPADAVLVSKATTKNKVMTVVLAKPDAAAKDDIILRLSKTGVPLATFVKEVTDAGTVLTAPIKGLKKGDSIAVVTRRHMVSAVAQVTRAMQVDVDHPELFRKGDVVARLAADGTTSAPSTIENISGGRLGLTPAIPDLVKNDLLLRAEPRSSKLPYTATVVSAIEQGGRTFVGVDRVTGAAAGDVIGDVTPGASVSSRALWSVESAGVTTLVLDAIGTGLAAGDVIGSIAFADAVVVESFDQAEPEVITLTEERDPRPDALIGPLAHFVETSTTSIVLVVAGDQVTLDRPLPELKVGELVGPASLTPQQPRIRLESLEDVRPGQQISVTAHDLNRGRLATALLRVANIDPTLKAVVLTPVQPSITHRFRPETMLAAVTYNANFAAGFAAFARRQGLYVGWLGCQQENAAPDFCPGVVPDDDAECSCGGDASAASRTSQTSRTSRASRTSNAAVRRRR
jgi:hypothetical protein